MGLSVGFGKQLESQMADLQANLNEIKEHQREARALLARTRLLDAAATPTTAVAERSAAAARRSRGLRDGA